SWHSLVAYLGWRVGGGKGVDQPVVIRRARRGACPLWGWGVMQAGRVHAVGKVLSFLVALPPSRDLLFCAKDLFVAARTMSCSHHKTSATSSGSVSLAIARKRSLTGHRNPGINGVFELVCVVGRGLVAIAEVHAIDAGAQLAQGKPEMARNRFGFLERHEYFKEMPQRYLWRGSRCRIELSNTRRGLLSPPQA